MYVFLSVVPIILATICAIALCVINKKTKLPGHASTENDGYMIVSTSDTNGLTSDNYDEDYSDITSNNNSTLV